MTRKIMAMTMTDTMDGNNSPVNDSQNLRRRYYSFQELIETIKQTDTQSSDFEFIAFTPIGRRFKDIKKYYLCHSISDLSLLEPSISDRYSGALRRICEIGLKPFDISTRTEDGSRVYLRMMFSVSDLACMSDLQIIEEFSELFHLEGALDIQKKALHFIKTDRMAAEKSLVQIGVEFDETGVLHSVKSYFVLDADYESDGRRICRSLDKLDGFAFKMKEQGCMVPDVSKATELFGDMFVPHLIGLNYAGGLCEVKLYGVAANISAGCSSGGYSQYITDRLTAPECSPLLLECLISKTCLDHVHRCITYVKTKEIVKSAKSCMCVLN